jgi:hypothetical protein
MPSIILITVLPDVASISYKYLPDFKFAVVDATNDICTLPFAASIIVEVKTIEFAAGKDLRISLAIVYPDNEIGFLLLSKYSIYSVKELP